jgi:hypothetical protein
VAGYLYTDKVTPGDILSAFDNQDMLINVGRLGIGIALLCNIPILVLPMRSIITSLLDGVKAEPPRPVMSKMDDEDGSLEEAEEEAAFQVATHGGNGAEMPVFRESNRIANKTVISYDTLSSHSEESSLEGDAANVPIIEVEALYDTQSYAEHVGVTFAIVALTYFVASLFPDVTIIWGICGSSVGILLVLTFPMAIYLKVLQMKHIYVEN